jgi:8-oxo-dGTP diphosphatase
MAVLAQISARCIVPYQNGFVMLRTKDKNPNARPPNEYWLLPGGGLERGETILKCAEREMLEETGLVVQALEVIHFREAEWDASDPSMFGPPGRSVEVFVRCEVVSGKLELGYDPETPDEYALLQVQVITLEKLKSITHFPDNLEQIFMTIPGTSVTLSYEAF